MKENFWQCQICGKIHCADVQLDIDGDLFVSMECPRCRGATQHLFVGHDKDDIYENYNCNLDERYFQYKNNTK